MSGSWQSFSFAIHTFRVEVWVFVKNQNCLFCDNWLYIAWSEAYLLSAIPHHTKQACSQVLKFGGTKYIFRGEKPCFCKTKFSGLDIAKFGEHSPNYPPMAGAALSRLLPIGPFAKRDPALRLPTYAHFLLKLLMHSSTGAGISIFKRGMRCNENQSELRGFNLRFHQNG